MIVTFASSDLGREHTRLLARTISRLASWGYGVLCIDWDMLGSTLSDHFPSVLRADPRAGLTELIDSYRRGQRPAIEHYTHRPALGATATIDLIPAGSPGAAPLNTEWAALYRDGLGSFLEECCEKWRAAYDFVVINGGGGDDPSRGIYL